GQPWCRLARVLEEPCLSHPGIAGEHAHTAQAVPNLFEQLVDRRSLLGPVKQRRSTCSATLNLRHSETLSRTRESSAQRSTRSARITAATLGYRNYETGGFLLVDAEFKYAI